MLSAQAMETLAGFREKYEREIIANFKTPAPAPVFVTLRYEQNRYYFEQILSEFTPDEICHNFVTDMVDHLIRRKIIKADQIEIGRATDAVKILQHYLLTRPDV